VLKIFEFFTQNQRSWN